MADVFISYAREDKAWAERLTKAIQLRGFSVWWDRKIAPGKTFDEVIQEALAEAKSVIVLWSKYSVQSDFVKDEAQRAANRDILVPVLIHEVPIPLGFGRIQTADLRDWDEDEFHPQFERVVESIAVHAGRELAHDERTGFRVLPPLPGPAIEDQVEEVPERSEPESPEPPRPAAAPEPSAQPSGSTQRPLYAVLALLVLIAAVAGFYVLRPSPGPDTPPDPPPEEVDAPEPPESVETPETADNGTPEGDTAEDDTELVDTGPTPAELEEQARRRYRELEEQRSASEASDEELLGGYRELRSAHEGHLSPQRLASLDETIESLEASLTAFASLEELEASGTATVTDLLDAWRELEPARPNGPQAIRARARIAELEEKVRSGATIASPEDFVTCAGVGENIEPIRESDRFPPGRVTVFARVRAPRAEKIDVRWLGSDGSQVANRRIDVSRNPDGYRLFHAHAYSEPGAMEVRLYNERGDLIGYRSFEVLSASVAESEGVAPPPRFSVRRRTVRDAKTRLTWTRRAQASGRKLSWNDADAACGALQLEGHDDWRLPTMAELRTLAAAQAGSFRLSAGIELDAAAVQQIWSADISSSKYLMLDLESGETVEARARRKQAGGVLCVRGPR